VRRGTNPLRPEEPTQDPRKADVDGDGLTLEDEEKVGTDPNNPDTDGDGVWDGDEVKRGTDPLRPETSADTNPPTVQISYEPANPTTDNQVTFTAQAWDDRELDRIEILVNAAMATTCYSSPCVYTGGPYPQGTVSYGANAYDRAENRAWTEYQYLTIAPYVSNSFDFDVFPDGTPIYGTTVLGGGEFSAWGLYFSAAPQGDYCAGAQAAVRVDVYGNYLSAALPYDLDSCAGTPVRIQFASPVRGVTIRFFGASVDYQLNAYDQAGSWLGGSSQQGELGQLREVTHRWADPVISYVEFGHQTAMTAIVEIIIER